MGFQNDEAIIDYDQEDLDSDDDAFYSAESGSDLSESSSLD